jgi:hypothetical protein
MGSIALLVLVCTSPWLLLPRSDAAATAPKLPVRAVNLGGWLVTEGWIKPSLFYGIPNNDTMVYTIRNLYRTIGKHCTCRSIC